MEDPGEGSSKYLTVSDIDRIIDSDSEYEVESSGKSYNPNSDDDNISSDGALEESYQADVASNNTETGELSANTLQSETVWVDSPDSMLTYLFTQHQGLRVPIPGNNEKFDILVC
ncbi:hypothetical protein J6590_084500 [Homalodisca vitripennis]|nr:hypothetical protein J6590_084500 [Homalodisca vitripennis]